MKKVLRNEEGFTLIEIIAVLVILGVLAAVAVPKYLDLMEDSKKKAADGALAAAISNVTMQYGSGLLSAGDEETALSAAVSNCNVDLTDLGDYTAAYALSTSSGVSIGVYDDDNNSASGAWEIY